MRWLLLLALLQAPTPGHGPYANNPNVKCYRGETRDIPNGKKLVHCDCKMWCDDDGNPKEANDCQTYCDNAHNQCLCHTDEACPPKGNR